MPIVRAKLLNRTKIEHWSHARLAMLTFYATCAVRVTIFSTGGEIPPCFDLYVVTLLL